MFETNDSQSHSIDNRKESNQVTVEDENNVREVEKYSQSNQHGMDNAMSCRANIQFLTSFDPEKLVALNIFLQEEQHGQSDKGILFLKFLKDKSF